MNNKLAILNPNSVEQLMVKAKVEAIQALVNEDRTVYLAGPEAEQFQETHFTDHEHLIKSWEGEQGVAFCNLYRNLVHPSKNREIEIFLTPAEYPLFRFLVEKTVTPNHAVTYTLIPSNIKGVFYEEIIQEQQILMSKYIGVLDSVEEPDVDEVLSLLSSTR